MNCITELITLAIKNKPLSFI